VSGIRKAIKRFAISCPAKDPLVFDQSVFVKQAISTVMREGGVGILLTAVMILVFLEVSGQPPVFLSIPLSVMIAFLSSISPANPSTAWSQRLGTRFSRLIDDSVVVLENVFRHVELGEEPMLPAVRGANEVV